MRCGIVLIFFLALSLVYGLRPTMRGLFHTIRRHCQQKVKISNEDFQKIRKAILNDDNKMQKCYIKCVLNSLNFMDESGKITPEKGFSTIPREMVSVLKPSINVCRFIDGVDPCEKAMNIYRCIHIEFPSITRFL